nr:DUF4893 domain-containing protein [Sphingomonas vulcanisoli]
MARDTAADRDKPYAWRGAVLPRDHSRLHNWRQAWLEALDAARAGGAGDKVAAEGALLDPDAAQNDPAVPDGAYRCRTIKLGGGRPYLEEPPVPCRIADGHFAELEGQQRIAGNFWRFDGVRLLLLGALALGEERGAWPYGRDEQRDVLAFFERLGPHRWRLTIPHPAWEAKLTVIELTPAA